jgi:hypothetical protein
MYTKKHNFITVTESNFLYQNTFYYDLTMHPVVFSIYYVPSISSHLSTLWNDCSSQCLTNNVEPPIHLVSSRLMQALSATAASQPIPLASSTVNLPEPTHKATSVNETLVSCAIPAISLDREYSAIGQCVSAVS